MAKHIVFNPVVTIDGDDYSDHFSEATIEGTFEEVEVTGFGSSFAEILLGTGDATITLQAYQDYATNSVDQNIWPIFINKSSVVVTVKPTNSATSATNPKYSMTGVISTYNPFAGAKGEANTTPLVFRNSAQAGLTRVFT